MKLLKKVSATAALVGMLVFASGCGGDKDAAVSDQSSTVEETGQQELTPQERYEAMNSFQQDITSMEARIKLEMDLTLGEERMQSVMDMRMTSFVDPLKIRMEMNMDMGELGTQQMAVYGEVTEDNKGMIYMYDGTSWTSQESPDITAALEQYDARSSVNVYVGGITDLTEAGREEINGRETVKLTGVFTGEDLKQSMLSTGSLNSLSGIFDQSQIDSILDNLENESSHVELWVDAETNELVKFTQDMTEVTDTIYKNVSALMPEGSEMKMSAQKMVVTIDSIVYNDAQDFEIPGEAKQ